MQRYTKLEQVPEFAIRALVASYFEDLGQNEDLPAAMGGDLCILDGPEDWEALDEALYSDYSHEWVLDNCGATKDGTYIYFFVGTTNEGGDIYFVETAWAKEHAELVDRVSDLDSEVAHGDLMVLKKLLLGIE
jgi:hypothetical protein